MASESGAGVAPGARRSQDETNAPSTMMITATNTAIAAQIRIRFSLPKPSGAKVRCGRTSTVVTMGPTSDHAPTSGPPFRLDPVNAPPVKALRGAGLSASQRTPERGAAARKAMSRTQHPAPYRGAVSSIRSALSMTRRRPRESFAEAMAWQLPKNSISAACSRIR